jgi:AraC-like DNA-binding protein
MVTEESQFLRPGSQAVIDQLVRLCFIKTLRSLILNSGSAGLSTGVWLATSDPLVGPALALIHTRPQTHWTVSALAREVDMSRSAFAERFRKVVGSPPLQYVTEVRMQKACDLLLDSELGVKEIAALVGYESSSSFTTVFKRRIGLSPALYRNQRISQPQDLNSSSREAAFGGR